MDVRNLFLRAVQTWPDREAIVTDQARFTFAEAWERGLRLANVLRELGVEPGDRVAVLEDNSLGAADFYLACTAGNFVRVPLYARNSTAAHVHMITNAGCKAVVVAENYANELPEDVAQLPGVRSVLVRDDSYEGLLARAGTDDPAPRVSSDDNYIIRYTAGTTGRSKGVAYSHWKWLAYCRDWMYQFPPVQVGDTNMCASPISHGSGYFFTPTWIGGGRNYMINKIDPKHTLDVMERERVAYMWCVPTLLGMLSREESARGRDWSSIKGFLVAGAPVSEATALAGREVFGDVLYSGYGQTECYPITSITPQEWFSQVPGSQPLRSAGRPYPFAMVRIVDRETGEDVEPGAEGEIVAKVDGQLSGYWNDPEATAEKIKDGWVHTGDIGRIDANGYLYLLDRASDMIISGGFNIYPAELENAIASHPEVVEVAVFAVPHEKWGEAPAAVCTVKDPVNVTEEDIVELCRTKVGSYKKPALVVISTDSLPKNAAGKILRRVLREPYWADKSQRVAGS
ncbi:AMP-binding protein [Dactylosporangium sp. AC04546]|uniref:class I adenylate-forming enzyme family protein n=1 Tax=Dactylosporangium sp. AC04546 TaxID=2862460 RepID=UPI001EE08B9F|nr:AMP-binding protein [Dactylosporangium sp. AC04546]WVK80883.1 AMP-binding protein [Dactylosporangium sp. AC04546]